MASLRKVVILRLAEKLHSGVRQVDGEDDDFRVDHEEEMINEIKRKTEVEEINTPAQAMALFWSNEYPAVLAVDGRLRGDVLLRIAAAQFVRRGGILVCASLFSGGLMDLHDFFSTFSLPWRCGDYSRMDYDLNPAMQHISHAGLKQEYDGKCKHIVHVDNADTLYTPVRTQKTQFPILRTLPDGRQVWDTIDMANSFLDSIPYTPLTAGGLEQTAIAMTKVGEGKLGYIGDQSVDYYGREIVMAMLGLN